MQNKRLKVILLNNITLAIIISLPFVFFANHFINKFKIEVFGPINLSTYKYLFYDDLNNDGNGDKIYFGENDLEEVYCKIFDPAHRGQFNTSGDFINYFINPFFTDVDDDGCNEILFFTQKDTSRVFINIVNYQKDSIQEFEICEVGIPGKRDFGASISDFIDLNRDGQKELIFYITAGFGLQPRAFFSLNPYSGELKRTPESGSKFSTIFIDDIDNDNFPELVTSSFTYQNYDSTFHFPYDDNWSRLFIFDHNLQFKAPPIKFSDLRSQVRAFPIQKDNSSMIYAFIDFRGDTTVQNRQYLINANGEIVKNGLFVEGNTFLNMEPSVLNLNDKLLVKDKNGFIYRIDPDLGLHKIKHLKEFKDCNVQVLDINSDGNSELLWVDQGTGKNTITDSRFKHPTEFIIPGNSVYWINPVTSKTEENKYLVRNSQGHFLVSYFQNPFWNLRFLLLTLIFVAVWLLLLMLNKIQSYKLKEKLRSERELQELQYRVITSQFSPHYTFNVLNTFSSQIYHKESPELYDYFNKFIRQLRYLYDDKNAVTRTLKEELQFCCDYLDIQKMRFKEKFDFIVNVDKEIDQSIRIPKMLLHIFVENAFKHGLRPLEEGGIITIDIKKEPVSSKRSVPLIIITITDNGIGREAAKIYSNKNPHYSSGRGLEMLNEFISLYNKDRKEKIEMITKDIFKENKSAGTTVKIIIPL